VRPAGACCQRDAADQPAAADRHEDRVRRLGQVLQQLQTERRLSEDHLRVVVGRHEQRTRRALGGLARGQLGEQRVTIDRDQLDSRRAQQSELGAGRGGGDEHAAGQME
jgi:hypothetical protein